ncbi:MAG: NHLP bacteriocin system secretion protein [Desulfovibrio sp.]
MAKDDNTSPDDLKSGLHSRLGVALNVVPTSSWLLVFSGLLVVGVAVYWAVFSVVPVKVHGQGILLRQDALHEVVALSDGQIDNLLVQDDEEVHEGQLLAVLSDPALEAEIAAHKKELMALDAEEKLLKTLGEQVSIKSSDHLKQRRRSLKRNIVQTRSRLSSIAKRMNKAITMSAKGLISEREYEGIRKEHDLALQQILAFEDELASLSVNQAERDTAKGLKLIDINRRRTATVQTLDTLISKKNETSQLFSPVTGRVVEIYRDRNELTKKGDSLISLEQTDMSLPLSVYAYFPAFKGRRMTDGMSVCIVPDVVQEEEFGFVRGVVEQVSSYPSSRKGMLRLLDNEQLVDQLSSGGAPIMVKIKVLKAGTVGGLDWSSGEGPPFVIKSGTLCTTSVVVEKVSPLNLLFPAFGTLFSSKSSQEIR